MKGRREVNRGSEKARQARQDCGHGSLCPGECPQERFHYQSAYVQWIGGLISMHALAGTFTERGSLPFASPRAKPGEQWEAQWRPWHAKRTSSGQVFNIATLGMELLWGTQLFQEASLGSPSPVTGIQWKQIFIPRSYESQ